MSVFEQQDEQRRRRIPRSELSIKTIIDYSIKILCWFVAEAAHGLRMEAGYLFCVGQLHEFQFVLAGFSVMSDHGVRECDKRGARFPSTENEGGQPQRLPGEIEPKSTLVVYFVMDERSASYAITQH